jgi:hypothetical protein
MSTKDSITFDDIEIDLGDYGAAPQSSTMIDTLDTITITGLSNQYSSMNTITLPSSNTITYGSNTITGSNGQFYTTGTSGYTINNTSPSVNITSNGIDMAAGTDIKVDGKSLKEFMNKMEQRLAILVPDPAKLEQFAALKKAYEHYKLMESLCQEPPKED